MRKKIMIISILSIILLLSGCTIGNVTFGTSTVPTKEAPVLKEYEVLNVGQYIETHTNAWGAVLRQEPAYYFTYIDEEGILHTESISHSNYGLCKVCVGDENKYVIEEKGVDTYKYLYLTKECLENM